MGYKLVDINEYIMTRDLYFKNEDTQTIDKCFDDYFYDLNLEIDTSYQCKIKLFGNIVQSNQKESIYRRISKCFSKDNSEKKIIICEIIDTEKIGIYDFYKVKNNEDIYYILVDDVKVENVNLGDKILFDWSRKDVIQINEMIDGFYLF